MLCTHLLFLVATLLICWKMHPFTAIAKGVIDILWCIRLLIFCQVLAVQQLQSVLTIAADIQKTTLSKTNFCRIVFVKVKKKLLHFLWNVYFSSISTLIKFSLCLLIIYEHTCETTLNKYCFSLLPQYQSKLIMIRCVLRSTCINAEMYFKSFITFT